MARRAGLYRRYQHEIATAYACPEAALAKNSAAWRILKTALSSLGALGRHEAMKRRNHLCCQLLPCCAEARHQGAHLAKLCNVNRRDLPMYNHGVRILSHGDEMRRLLAAIMKRECRRGGTSTWLIRRRLSGAGVHRIAPVS